MSTLYWFYVLGSIKVVATVALACVLSTVVICAFAAIGEKDIQDWCKRTKARIWAMWIGVISLLLVVFIPDRKELFFIYCGGTVLEYFENNPQAKEIPDNLVRSLNDYLTKEKYDFN